jgi:uncharacterized protein
LLTDAEIADLVGRIADHLRPERVILIGSYAKGTATPSSDLDILVVLDTPMAKRYRPQLIAPLIRGRSIPVDAHIYTPSEVAALGAVRFSFMDAWLRTGRVMFDRENGRR